METKMLMRIYARATGGSTDNPPYLRTSTKQPEKLRAYSSGRAGTAMKIAKTRLQETSRSRY